MSDESASHVGDLVSVSIVTHQLNILLIVAPLGAMLVPFVCTLFAFTPREIRRKPVFIVNIAACVLGIIQATAIVALNYQILAFPNDPMPISMYLSKIGILLLPPIFIDAVIIFRFLAFFPVQLTPRRTLLAVLAFPVICKIARLALVCGFMGTYPLENLSGPRSVTIQGFLWSRRPALSVIFGLQSVDNTYASSIFLYKLYQFRKNGVNILHNEVLMRITSIFLIGLGNYIFPVTVNIVQTVLTFTSPGLTSGIYIIFTNNFLSILSGVFATLWICKQNWARRIVDTSTPPAASINYRDNKAVYDGGDDDDEGLGVYP